VDLNKILSPKGEARRISLKARRSEDKSNSENETEPTVKKNQRDKWNIVAAVASLLSAIIVSIGLYFNYKQNNQQNRLLQALNNTAERFPPTTTTESLVPRTQPTPISETQQSLSRDQRQQTDDARLLKLIAGLYDAKKNTRITAMSQLQQDQTAHERVIPLLLQFAGQNQVNDIGIGNTLVVLQGIKPEVLAKYKNEIKVFTDTVKNSKQQYANLANKVAIQAGNQ
jgi:hypothetical protein